MSNLIFLPGRENEKESLKKEISKLSDAIVEWNVKFAILQKEFMKSMEAVDKFICAVNPIIGADFEGRKTLYDALDSLEDAIKKKFSDDNN